MSGNYGLSKDELDVQFQFIGRFTDELRVSHITRTHDTLEVLLDPDKAFELPSEERELPDADPEYAGRHFDRLDKCAKEFYQRIVRAAIYKYGPDILPDEFGALNG